mgnify:CR=1 FL=1
MTVVQQDKRSAILETLLDLVVERGFHDAPMALLASRAGVSAGVIYHYFASKDEVIQALVTQLKAEQGKALIAGEPYLLPFPDNIKRLWLNGFRYYVAHPRQTIFLEQYKNSPFPQQFQDEWLDENTLPLAQMIQHDIEQGVIQRLPLEALHDMTLGVAIMLAKRQIRGEIQLDEDALERVALACCRAIQPI